jgi:hypothetical protein
MVIELSKEEQDLIIAKREKEEADKRAKEAELAVGLANAKVKIESKFAAYKIENDTKNAAIKNIFNEFNENAPGYYKLIENLVDNVRQCEYLAGKYIEEFRKFDVSKIECIKHPTVDFDVRKEDGKWKIHCGLISYTRNFSNFKKLHEKIVEHFASLERKSIEALKTLDLQDQAIELLKKMYPGATYQKDSTSIPDYSSRRSRPGTYSRYNDLKLVKVTFPNTFTMYFQFSQGETGVKVTCRSYSMNEIDQVELIKACINLPKKTV